MKKLFRVKLFLKKKLMYMFLLGIICLYFADNTTAQDAVTTTATGQGIHFGGKFGTTVTQFTNQQPHTTVKQGITAGGFFNYSFNNNMAIQLELNYLQEGGQLLCINLPGDISYVTWYGAKIDNQNVTLHNLDIPLLFKYSYPLGASKVFVVAGPALGINFHSSIKHETTVFTNIGSFHTYTGEENITSKIERYNIGITAGLGFEIPVFNKNYIIIDARYRYGMMPVYKGYSYRGIPQITGNLKNNTMYFTVGLGF